MVLSQINKIRHTCNTLLVWSNTCYENSSPGIMMLLLSHRCRHLTNYLLLIMMRSSLFFSSVPIDYNRNGHAADFRGQ